MSSTLFFAVRATFSATETTMATIILVGNTASGDIEKEISKLLTGTPHRMFQFHRESVGHQSRPLKRFPALQVSGFPPSITTRVRFTAFAAPRIVVALEPFIPGESKTAVYVEEGELFKRASEHRCSDWCVFGDIWREITEVLPDLKKSATA